MHDGPIAAKRSLMPAEVALHWTRTRVFPIRDCDGLSFALNRWQSDRRRSGCGAVRLTRVDSFWEVQFPIRDRWA